MSKSPQSIDMTNGSIADKLLLFALPLMASTILQLLFNAVDIVVVGRFVGKEALAAVGSNTALVNLLIAIFTGLSVGTNVVIARHLGGKNYESASRSVHTAIFLSLISGIFIAIFGFIMANQLLIWMSSPEDVIRLGTIYLRIYFLGMPGQLVYNFGAAVLRAKGDTRRPLNYLTVAGIVNVVLNLILVMVFHLSVAGVALATIASQYISAFLVIRCLIQEVGPLHLDVKKLGLDWKIIQDILFIGLPAGFQSTLFSLANVMIQSTVNSFDSDVMSGSAAGSSIDAFIYMGMNAFHQAALTFIGQNYGARKPQRIDRIVIYSLFYAILSGFIMGFLVYYNGRFLLNLYIPGEERAIQFGLIRMSNVTRMYAFCAVMDIMVGVLRGLNKSLMPMLVSVMGVCGLRLVWIYVVFPLNPTPGFLFLSYPITWGVTGFALVVMFLLVRKPTYATLDANYIPSSTRKAIFK